jgi:hypothetical protein
MTDTKTKLIEVMKGRVPRLRPWEMEQLAIDIETANLLAKPTDGRVVGEELIEDVISLLGRVDKTYAETRREVNATISALRAAPHAQDQTPSVQGVWISVKERLPEIGKTVFVTQVGEGGHDSSQYESRIWKAVLMDNGDFWTNDTMLPTKVWGVINWQPLPPPPQPEKGS